MQATKEILTKCKQYKDTIMGDIKGILDNSDTKYTSCDNGLELLIEEDCDIIKDKINQNIDIEDGIIDVLLSIIPSPSKDDKMTIVRLRYN